ncbi:MAG: hypothetical protein AAF682_27665 [Planctomycetota bacterium]
MGRKPTQSVEKRRREREKHFKRREKAERRAQLKDEQERKKLAGEADVPVNPMDEIPEAQVEEEKPQEPEG